MSRGTPYPTPQMNSAGRPAGESTKNDAFGDLLSGFTPAVQSKPLNALRPSETGSASWSVNGTTKGADMWDLDALASASERRSMTNVAADGRKEDGFASLAALSPASPANPLGSTTASSRNQSRETKPDAFSDLGDISFGQQPSLLGLAETQKSNLAKSTAAGTDPWDLDFLSTSVPSSPAKTPPLPSANVPKGDRSPSGGPLDFRERDTSGTSDWAQISATPSSPKTSFRKDEISSYSATREPDDDEEPSFRDDTRDFRFISDAEKPSERATRLAGSIMGFGQQVLGKAASSAAKVLNAASKTAVRAATETFQGRISESRTPPAGSSSRFRDSSDDEDSYDEPPVANVPRSTQRTTLAQSGDSISQQKAARQPGPRVDPDILSAADHLRQEGNDHFKAGRFPEAVEKYSLSMDLLPPEAAELVTLYNNRGATYFKIGDYNATIADCTSAQRLAAGDLKSLARRAMAFEGLEKWRSAETDYRQLLAIQSNFPVAAQGLARCRQAQGIDEKGWSAPRDSAPAVSSRPAPVDKGSPKAVESNGAKDDLALLFDPHHVSNTARTTGTSASRPTEDLMATVSPAVQKLRLEDQAAAASETERIRVKDAVDLKISLWLSKRENNIRALLASLELVLWPELGLRNSAMSDLINPAQVKKHYLRVITRTHPDKVCLLTRPQHILHLHRA